MYISTRGNYTPVTASEAIRLGMVPTGGLFVPAEPPSLSMEEILEMQGKPYQEAACRIMTLFLHDFRPEEISDCVAKAYSEKNFDHSSITPCLGWTTPCISWSYGTGLRPPLRI